MSNRELDLRLAKLLGAETVARQAVRALGKEGRFIRRVNPTVSAPSFR